MKGVTSALGKSSPGLQVFLDDGLGPQDGIYLL